MKPQEGRELTAELLKRKIHLKFRSDKNGIIHYIKAYVANGCKMGNNGLGLQQKSIISRMNDVLQTSFYNTTYFTSELVPSSRSCDCHVLMIRVCTMGKATHLKQTLGVSNKYHISPYPNHVSNSLSQALFSSHVFNNDQK